MNKFIPFNKAHIAGKELYYITQAVNSGEIKGDGNYTKLCQAYLESQLGARKALLTNSCTASLEMSAILLGIDKEDEVILPSYTFTSTANAFILRGARPVFVDIRADTLNIDEDKIENAIGPRSKIICPVHYAGVSCEMDEILTIAKKYNLFVVEDAAQGVMAKYKGKYLGTMGDIGTYSFHETKNLSSGEGGALIINNIEFLERSEYIREAGTNRSKFLRGEIDKYTWVDIGGSFLSSEIVAAYLYAQLENSSKVTETRLGIWRHYHQKMEPLEKKGLLRRPQIPKHCDQNGHIYYVLLENIKTRNNLLKFLKNRNVNAVFHYIPLHSSPMGKLFGYRKGDLPITEHVSETIVRLPFFNDISEKEIDYIVESVSEFFK